MSRTYNKGSSMSRTKNIIDDYRFKRRMFYQNVQLLTSGRKFRDEKVQRKCLTKGAGSENLRRAIDEYWEGFERKRRGVTK